MSLDGDEVRRELDAGRLLQAARDAADLSDFGDESFLVALDKLLESRVRDIRFHAAGLVLFRDEVVRNLVNRLRFQDDIKRHPEILDEDVSDPVIIIGLPRSGTTKAQRMLGEDQALFKTYMWQLMNPAPFPPLPDAMPGQPDPRIVANVGSHAGEGNAAIQAAHYLTADVVEEDWQLFEFTLNDWYPNGRGPARSWHDWVLSRQVPSDLDNYRYVRSLFQYLQWQQGGRQGEKGQRRWLMKSCGHLAFLPELLEVFPAATLVHIHRHPAASIASLSKIMSDFWGMRMTDVDPGFVGQLMLDWARIHVDRYLAARERLQLDGRILDVPYDRIRDDPMPVFKEIYRRAGMVLSAEAEQAMRQWEQGNEQGKHGRHVYSLEQFGLSDIKIEAAFGAYIRRFIEH